jgi:hypothetical protein
MNSNSIGVWDTRDLFCICLGSNQWFGKCIPRTSQAATAAQEQAASLVIFIDEEIKKILQAIWAPGQGNWHQR